MASRVPRAPHARLYSPAGCGCALVLLPVLAGSVVLTGLALGYAFIALCMLVAAVAITVAFYRQRGQRAAEGRGLGGWVAVPIVLYLLSVPYLILFIGLIVAWVTSGA